MAQKKIGNSHFPSNTTKEKKICLNDKKSINRNYVIYPKKKLGFEIFNPNGRLHELKVSLAVRDSGGEG